MNDSRVTGKNNDPLTDINQIIHAPSRLRILALLYIVTSLDYVFLKNQTDLSWGHLATHLKKLEEVGYISIHKSCQGRNPQSKIQLTAQGRKAFQNYKKKACNRYLMICQIKMDYLPE